MNAKQLRAALERLDMTQMDLSRLIDKDPRTVRSWVLDQARMPRAEAILVRLLIDGKLTIADVESAK